MRRTSQGTVLAMWGCRETISLMLSLQTFDFWTEASRKLKASPPAALSLWFKACLEQVTAKQAGLTGTSYQRKQTLIALSSWTAIDGRQWNWFFSFKMYTATLLNSLISFPTLSMDSLDFSRQILCFAKGTCKQYKFWLPPFKYLQA